jgi:hypothetical protein
MLLGAELVRAAHPALKDRKETLDGVGLDAPAPVFAGAVVDAPVAKEIGVKLARIDHALIG